MTSSASSSNTQGDEVRAVVTLGEQLTGKGPEGAPRGTGVVLLLGLISAYTNAVSL